MTRRITATTGLAAALIVLMLWIDRPIALWFDARFHGSILERAFVLGFMGLDRILPYLGVALAAAIVALRIQSSSWLRRIVSGGVAAVVALLATEIMKFMVGRTHVYPAFLRDRIYEFHPLSGGSFMAFPSATMAGAVAFLVGLDLRRDVARPVIAAVIIFLAAALLITSGHWMSDIVGGTVLGLVTGRAGGALSSRVGLTNARASV